MTNELLHNDNTSLHNLLRLSICCFFVMLGASMTLAQSNTATTLQEGTHNEISIIQEQTEGALLENVIFVQQDGHCNTANIAQVGEGNELYLLQDGYLNLYELNLDGSNIVVHVVQDGHRNEIQQTVTNSSNVTVELEQIGNNNSIIHELDGISNKNYTVRQIGDGMSVIIRQSGGGG